LDAAGKLAKTEILALATTHLEALLGIDDDQANSDMVITTGGELFDFEAKVTGIIVQGRGVEIF
jgi:hypothetical protein